MDYTIFVVEDADVNRRMMEGVLRKLFIVESFADGHSFLERISVKLPNLILLDVGLPDIDGYSLCKKLKENVLTSMVPVIFVSGHDDLESKITGYDAGGHDFITKPCNFQELKLKIDVLRQMDETHSSLQDKIVESEGLVELVMSNLDEYAVLIKFLRALNTCNSYSEISEAMLSLLRSYHLTGAIQYRLPDNAQTIDHNGTVNPLEDSILRHVLDMGSIVSFKNRSAFNYGYVSVLINNMPLADPDYCGRLRDHLAIAVETLNSKAFSIYISSLQAKSHASTEKLLYELNNVIQDFNSKYDIIRFMGAEAVRQMLLDVETHMVSFHLVEAQEELLKEIIETGTDKVISIFDSNMSTRNLLEDILSKIKKSQTD